MSVVKSVAAQPSRPVQDLSPDAFVLDGLSQRELALRVWKLHTKPHQENSQWGP